MPEMDAAIRISATPVPGGRGFENMTPERWWHMLLTGEGLKTPMRETRHFFRLLPADRRCKFCSSPFDGFSASAMRTIGRGPSRLTSVFCHQCRVATTKHMGGAEIELTLLFADVRGSTSLAEKMSPSEFSLLISRFSAVAGQTLLKKRAWVDRLVGDQVVGMFIPYYVGGAHQMAAIGEAKTLLRKTGHDSAEGPWIPFGVGVHTGPAFVGSGLDIDLEERTLDLKEKSEPLSVQVLKNYS